jgi:hypothetical protein
MNYYFNIKTHQVAMHPPDHWVIGDSTNHPTCLIRLTGTYGLIPFDVQTSFTACDARYRGWDLEHITEPLVFKTWLHVQGKCQSRCYWATYEQAKLGHEYWCHSVAPNAIEDLSRNRGYVQLAYRKAIELSIVGYESDSLSFITL